jgi:hypothetical protein
MILVSSDGSSTPGGTVHSRANPKGRALMETSELCQACGAYNSSVGTAIQTARQRVDLCPPCFIRISTRSVPANGVLRTRVRSAAVRLLCRSCGEPCQPRRMEMYGNDLSRESPVACFVCYACSMLPEASSLQQPTTDRISERIHALIRWITHISGSNPANPPPTA